MVYAVVVAWLVLAAVVVATWGRIGTDRAWRGFVLALTLGLSLVHQLLFATVTEDALVSFRYALNIADGNGPVFNPGERVEGYTNFLWLVLIALPRAAFGADIAPAAVVLSVLSALGCVLLAYLLVNRIVEMARPAGEAPRPEIGVAAAVLTAGASGLAVYGPSGSEVPLFVLLILGVCYSLAARRPLVAGVLAAFAVMTRPEGLVLAVFAGLWLVIAAARGRHSWWAPAGYVLGALVFLGPKTAWRLTFYEHILPAPVAARFGGSFDALVANGWPYLSGFSLVHQGFLLLALVAAVALLLRRPPDGQGEARSLIWLLYATVAGIAAVVVLLGGDVDPSWRLFVPLPPLLAVASVSAYGVLTAAVSTKPSPRPRGWPAGTRLVPVTACGLAGIAVLVSVFSPEMLDRVRDWRAHGTELAEIGGWLGAYLPPGSVVSGAAPGALSVNGGQLMIVDVLGQTDDHIARDGQHDGGVATDYDYVVNGRRPTVAIPSDGGYADRQRCVIDPVYAGKYQVATFRRVGTPYWVAVYPRAEQAQTVVADLDKDPDFHYVPCPS